MYNNMNIYSNMLILKMLIETKKYFCNYKNKIHVFGSQLGVIGDQ